MAWLHEKQAYVLVIFSNYGKNQQFKIVPCEVIRNPGNFGLSRNPESTALESGIQLKWNPESEIEFSNLESSHLWNLESMDVDSGIHRHGIRNPQRQIGNPRLSWTTLHVAINRHTVLK